MIFDILALLVYAVVISAIVRDGYGPVEAIAHGWHTIRQGFATWLVVVTAGGIAVVTLWVVPIIGSVLIDVGGLPIITVTLGRLYHSRKPVKGSSL